MPTESMNRKQRGSSYDDELAPVKAAAWAWYQHGSANESNPTCEFDLARRRRRPRPSRYKLEATAAARGDHLSSASSEPPSLPRSPAAAELTLLDPYEVERISMHLDRLIASTRGAGVGSRARHGPPGRGKGAAKLSGFWLRHAVGLCWSRADVAEAGMLVGGRGSPVLPRIDASM